MDFNWYISDVKGEGNRQLDSQKVEKEIQLAPGSLFAIKYEDS